jgi:hypothetical protein
MIPSAGTRVSSSSGTAVGAGGGFLGFCRGGGPEEEEGGGPEEEDEEEEAVGYGTVSTPSCGTKASSPSGIAGLEGGGGQGWGLLAGFLEAVAASGVSLGLLGTKLLLMLLSSSMAVG